MKKPRDPQGQQVDGLRIAAELLAALEPEHRRKLMGAVATRDPEIARKLGERILLFDDLIRLTDSEFKILLKEIPHSKLILALRRATPVLQEKIYANMTARAGEMLKEEVQTQGLKRVSDIAGAQNDILKIALRLESEGKIVVTGPQGKVAG